MSSVIWNPSFIAVVENDITLCPNERDAQFKFCVHLFGRVRRPFVFSSYNRKLFSNIQFFTSEMCYNRRKSAMNMMGKNRGFDLNFISKQVENQRMSSD